MFQGFKKEGIQFLEDLKQNNHRDWFNNHKQTYEHELLEPARSFVILTGERLQKWAPEIHADPRRDKSIFRIYRDTRFSKDKSPYKTHLGIFFWEGHLPKMECPGLYFHLEPPNFGLFAGMHQFSPQMLKEYRNAVLDPVTGKELEISLEKIKKQGSYEIGGLHYKRVPKGCDPAHPQAELLRYNGLWAGMSSAIPPELFTEIALIHEPKRLATGDWCPQGYPFYTDAMVYRRRFRVRQRRAVERTVVEWDHFEGTVAAVWMNGEKAAVVGWRPYRV
ncbi:MAG: DUF2461 domain-containing protein, partial [Spirochaetota bacterium]